MLQISILRSVYLHRSSDYVSRDIVRLKPSNLSHWLIVFKYYLTSVLLPTRSSIKHWIEYHLLNLYLLSLRASEHFKRNTCLFQQTNIALNSLTVTCQAGSLTYLPNQPLWPQCVSYLPCTDPVLDTEVMTFDWNAAKGTLPNVTIK